MAPRTGTGSGRLAAAKKHWSWAAVRNWHWTLVAVAMPIAYAIGLPVVIAGTLAVLERPQITKFIENVADANVSKRFGRSLNSQNLRITEQAEAIQKQTTATALQNQKLEALEEGQKDGVSELRKLRRDQNTRFDALQRALLLELRRMR